MDDIVNKLDIDTQSANNIESAFCEVDSIQGTKVTVSLTQRPGTYSDCLIIGDYIPKKNDKGLLLFIQPGYKPVFYPFTTKFATVSGAGDSGSFSAVVLDDGMHDFSSVVNRLSNNYNEFYSEVSKICKEIGIANPDHLMMLMFCESALNPQEQNKSSGAIGLIQFYPVGKTGGDSRLTSAKDEKGNKLTITQVKQYNNITQLQLVKRYFLEVKKSGLIDSLEGVVSVVFYPDYGTQYDKELPDYVKKANGGIYSIRNYADIIRKKCQQYIVKSSINISNTGNIKLKVN